MVRIEGSDDKPITRRECDKCPLHTEVENMKSWVSKMDGRMWAGLILAVTNLIGIAATLAVLLLKQAPAIAAAAK